MLIKQYARGLLIILTTSLGVVLLTVSATRKALLVLEGINSGQIAADPAAIAAAVSRYEGSGTLVDNAALILVAACWVFGTVDAYRRADAMNLP